ncbi:SBBP repeat-containing protein [Flammeovirgaceae bacterium SG7u.111]|nr:SBBP repeat-containing protein [Flammeovirgaceae bacterium SG7u.132]WPO36989.1 SBBP repeat-containing protein [Flammeovirgaceae bacterium SG7u.111]
MQKNILTVALLLAFFTENSFSQKLEWLKSIGGNESDYGHAITHDNLGNIFITGFFYGTADFDPGPGVNELTSSYGDAYVVKLGPNGSYKWAKNLGWGHANSITTDDDGNVFIAGEFQNKTDFDPGPGIFEMTTAGFIDVFIVKLDNQGDFVWAKRFGGESSDQVKSITADPSGNLLLTGNFTSTANYNEVTSITSDGIIDAFIMKLNTDGDIIWLNQLGDRSGSVVGASIAASDDESVYLTGHFTGVVDFDPSLGSLKKISTPDVIEAFALKLSKSGKLLWVNHFGSKGDVNGSKVGQAITADNHGDIYVTGYFGGEIDFDPQVNLDSLVSLGNHDVFVVKLTSDGAFQWSKRFDGGGYEKGYSIDTDLARNIYVAGTFRGNVEFGSRTLISEGDDDAFALQLDSEGNLIWAKRFGGNKEDRGTSISIDNVGNASITGYYRSTASFNPISKKTEVSSVATTDIFILKLGKCTSVIETNDIITTCEPYIWRDGITYTESTDSAIYLLADAVGCDSIFTLDLTINYPTYGSDILTSCEPYTWIDGVTYHESTPFPTYTLTNSVGCDSIVTLNLTINTADASVAVDGYSLVARASGASYQWLDCDRGYLPISGEIGKKFTPESVGNYAVEVTENGCIDTSTCIAVNIVGILENSISNELIIYPNPTVGDVFIDFGKTFQNIDVEVSDLKGRIVLKEKYSNKEIVDFTLLGESGVYIVKLSVEKDKEAVIKVLKK